jgi:hypothetical protein
MHIKSVEDSLCIKRLMWLGRLTRMDGNRLVSRVWGAECHGKRALVTKAELSENRIEAWSVNRIFRIIPSDLLYIYVKMLHSHTC